MNKILKIAHTADWHIRVGLSRLPEYNEVFNNFIEDLKQSNPNRIVIVGDIFHNYIEPSNEGLLQAGDVLIRLAQIAKVIITRGNHDIQKKNLKRVDSIQTVVELINNPNVVYLNKTGFFEDENVVWVVWHHGDKINPWKDIPHVKDETKTYIDLYHNPIRGSVSATGFNMDSPSYISINEFCGNLLLSGDIHQFQKFNKNDKLFGAYSSSLIMQDFAEVDRNSEKAFHGYLMWDISNKENITMEQRPIQNRYSFQKINVNRFFDFEDIEIDIEFPTEFMKISVVWNTFPAFKTPENIDKIAKYLNTKYKGILSIRHENKFLVEEKITVAEDSINLATINEKETQNRIISEFLTEKGYQEDIINDVIKLDDTITGRLDVSNHTNIIWDVIRLETKNLFSFEDLVIDFRDLKGIIQVLGKNRNGKTTATIKSIMYVLFGKTIETSKVQKNGDDRYINNKLDVDFCNGTVILTANGEYFGIKRETTRKWNKARTEISSTPTTVKYYKLNSPDDELNDNNILSEENTNLTEDIRRKTQKKIDEIIGNYDDFVRIAITTGDNLNNLLSVNKSEFIDSVMSDAGFDLCDLKLEEFKKYKKDYFKTKEKIVLNIELSENDINQKNVDIIKFKDEINTIQSINIVDVENRIKTGNEYKTNLSSKLHNIDPEVLNTNVNDINQKISRHNDGIRLKNEELTKLNDKISTLPSEYNVEEFNNCEKQKDEHKQFVYDHKIKINNIKLEIDTLTNKKFAILGEIELIKRDGKRLREEITSLNESQTCPTCNQLKSKEALVKIQELVDIKNIKINDLLNDITNKNALIKTVESDIIAKQEESKQIQTVIDNKGLEMEGLLDKIGQLQNQKNQVEEREKLILKASTIPIEIENLNLLIENLNNKIKLYEDLKIKIEENVKTNDLINKANLRIDELYREKQEFNNKISSLNNNINNINTYISELNLKIVKYKEQQKVETVFNEYELAMHRDGIPKTLLTKYALPLINNELKESLVDMDFSIWLDGEDFTLKMSNNSKPKAVIDCIAGSGKERTFSAVVLKYALSQINGKSKPSFFFFDEVMSKLVDESVEEFVMLLHSMKNRVKKIFIIEHAREINPDHTIMVLKNENDVSYVEI